MTVVAFLPAVGVWLVWAPAVGYLAITSGPVPALALFLYGVTVLSLVDNYLRAIFVDRDSGSIRPSSSSASSAGSICLESWGCFSAPSCSRCSKRA